MSEGLQLSPEIPVFAIFINGVDTGLWYGDRDVARVIALDLRCKGRWTEVRRV